MNRSPKVFSPGEQPFACGMQMASLHQGAKATHRAIGRALPVANPRTSTQKDAVSCGLARCILLREGTPAPMRKGSKRPPCPFPPRHVLDLGKMSQGFAQSSHCCACAQGISFAGNALPTFTPCLGSLIWHARGLFSQSRKSSTGRGRAIRAWCQSQQRHGTRDCKLPAGKLHSLPRRYPHPTRGLLRKAVLAFCTHGPLSPRRRAAEALCSSMRSLPCCLARVSDP